MGSEVTGLVFYNNTMFFTAGKRSVRMAIGPSISDPTSQPSRQPTSRPSRQPSRQPTSRPSRQPSSKPSLFPTAQPTVQPTVDYDVETVIGSSTAGGSGVFTDGVDATPLALLSDPHQLYFDSNGLLYVADLGANVVMKMDTDGKLFRVAGKGTNAAGTNNVQATSVILTAPSGVCLDPSGNIYISEWSGYRIRKITASTGIINTYAGTGGAGSTGSGGLATNAKLKWPEVRLFVFYLHCLRLNFLVILAYCN